MHGFSRYNEGRFQFERKGFPHCAPAYDYVYSEDSVFFAVGRCGEGAAMRVTCSTQSLGQGLHVVSRAVSSRTTLPILNNVLMQTDPAGLRLTATNLEI